MVPIPPFPNSNAVSPALFDLLISWLITTLVMENDKRGNKFISGVIILYSQSTPQGDHGITRLRELGRAMLEEQHKISNEFLIRLEALYHFVSLDGDQLTARMTEIVASEQEATLGFNEFVDRIVMG